MHEEICQSHFHVIVGGEAYLQQQNGSAFTISNVLWAAQNARVERRAHSHEHVTIHAFCSRVARTSLAGSREHFCLSP